MGVRTEIALWIAAVVVSAALAWAVLSGAAAQFHIPSLGAGSMQNAMPKSNRTGSACENREEHCDLLRAVLGSLEDTWSAQLNAGRAQIVAGSGAYEDAVTAVFVDTATSACGLIHGSAGPRYCRADRQIYWDPAFVEALARRSPVYDFGAAYLLAHEFGHHVQELTGTPRLITRWQWRDRVQPFWIRYELQADCFAGVWAGLERERLKIDDVDLREGLSVAYSLGNDTIQRQNLGYVNAAEFSHGTAEQRMRWLRRGFDTGDPKACDTFAELNDDLL